METKEAFWRKPDRRQAGRLFLTDRTESVEGDISGLAAATVPNPPDLPKITWLTGGKQTATWSTHYTVYVSPVEKVGRQTLFCTFSLVPCPETRRRLNA